MANNEKVSFKDLSFALKTVVVFAWIWAGILSAWVFAFIVGMGIGVFGIMFGVE